MELCFVLRGLESMALPLEAPPSDVSCTSLQLASSVGSGSSAQTENMAGKTSVQQVLEILKKRGQQVDSGKPLSRARMCFTWGFFFPEHLTEFENAPNLSGIWFLGKFLWHSKFNISEIELGGLAQVD